MGLGQWELPWCWGGLKSWVCDRPAGEPGQELGFVNACLELWIIGICQDPGAMWLQELIGTRMSRGLDLWEPAGTWDHETQLGPLQPAGTGIRLISVFVGAYSKLLRSISVGLVLGQLSSGVCGEVSALPFLSQERCLSLCWVAQAAEKVKVVM